MTAVTPRHGARASAIDDLLGALETLVAQYRSLPETERERRWSRDAERITGEVGSHLDVARSRVRSAFIAPAPTADDRGGMTDIRANRIATTERTTIRDGGGRTRR